LARRDPKPEKGQRNPKPEKGPLHPVADRPARLGGDLSDLALHLL
jgi:hypothetical protein